MGSQNPRVFNAQAFLDVPGLAPKGVAYPRGATIFGQGDVCDSVMYIQTGRVKLSVRSKGGREAIVARLEAGNFFGEGCLAGQPVRMGNATAMAASTILVLKKKKMALLLQQQPDLADRFISHMLGTNIRIEEELLDQLFNHQEKRLARALLLLARYGMKDEPERVLPNISRSKLATLAGISRAKVDFFIDKFERLGFISDHDGLIIHNSLLSVVLHD